MAKVIKSFFDLQDGNYEYKVGEEYPRKGYKATEERLVELAGNKNKMGEAVIKITKSKKTDKNKE
jgi:hypothetical protein